jgi:two-component system, OmpR family, sensor kinase
LPCSRPSSTSPCGGLAPPTTWSVLSARRPKVDRLTRLAEDLLVLARADERRLPLRRSSVSAKDLLDTVARRYAGRAASEGRRLEVAASGRERIHGDRIRLEQALGNLVDNALRHGAGTVRLEAGRDDGHVELRVTDHGAGFPGDLLPRAFDRFARADEARGGSASGLGLAIVDAIAVAHGGMSRATNDAGGGAVVSLILPADEGAAAIAAAERGSRAQGVATRHRPY